MADKKIKDVTGVIDTVGQVKEKELVAKRGKNKGKKFTLYQVGIRLDDGEWYNVSEYEEEKAIEKMYSSALGRNFRPGDKVKLYLEGKYENVKAITLMNEDSGMRVDMTSTGASKLKDGKGEVASENAGPKKTPIPKENKKEWKTAEADKYEAGMAKNNAAIIIGAIMSRVKAEEILENQDFEFAEEAYPKLAKRLYEAGRKMRIETLGY